MVVRRSRVVAAPVDAVWRVVADPHRLPAWWPRTAGVEAVRAKGWTSVLVTPRGRTVRAAFRVTASEPRRRRRWEQQLPGTPFAEVLVEAVTEVQLAAEDGATRVTLELRQRARGMARFGAPLLRGAARRQLDEALGGLAAVVEG